MAKVNTVAKVNDWMDLDVRHKLYRDYANAVEAYMKEPTVNNWEKKEKAFETYNALFENFRDLS